MKPGICSPEGSPERTHGLAGEMMLWTPTTRSRSRCVLVFLLLLLASSCHMLHGQEKGQADVDTQFSLGHRWRGGQNVRLRLGVTWRRGPRNVCVRETELGWGGSELFVNARRMCVQESVCVNVKEGRNEKKEGRNEKKAGGSVANRRRRWCEKEQRRESGVAGKGGEMGVLRRRWDTEERWGCRVSSFCPPFNVKVFSTSTQVTTNPHPPALRPTSSCLGWWVGGGCPAVYTSGWLSGAVFAYVCACWRYGVNWKIVKQMRDGVAGDGGEVELLI
ncbi:hypothetical protein PAMA_016612 [Pampus argenteus]